MIAAPKWEQANTHYELRTTFCYFCVGSARHCFGCEWLLGNRRSSQCGRTKREETTHRVAGGRQVESDKGQTVSTAHPRKIVYHSLVLYHRFHATLQACLH
jgi:hypothetical protein